MINAENITVNDYADVLKLLGDKTRLSILKILEQTECCVCLFADLFDISQSAISQHMRKLKDLDLVKEDPHKQWIFYSLNTDSKYYGFIKSILEQIPEDVADLKKVEADVLEMNCP